VGICPEPSRIRTHRQFDQAMSAEQVEVALGVIDDREKVILRLAVFAGMRPCELLAMQREHVKKDASVIEIRHRVYRGKFASPKNWLGPDGCCPFVHRRPLRQWMQNAAEPKPESFVFAGETGQPLWRPSLLEDYIKAKLEPVGLGWVNFQVMRRTHAGLGRQSEGFGGPTRPRHRSSVDVYTKSSMKDRATAAKKLEDSVLPKAVRARKRSA